MNTSNSATIIPLNRTIIRPQGGIIQPGLAPPIGRGRTRTGRRSRLLLAEDDPDLLHALKARLFHHGYDVTAVLDGDAARWSLLSCRYDAVVLDLGLPKTHGLDVLTDVGSRKNLPPTVVLTGGDDDREQDLALTFGARLVLRKPCPFKELSAAIDRILLP